MEISAFTLKLIILVIPGALGAIIIERLTVHKRQWSPFKFVVNSILVGLIAYLVNELVVGFVNWFASPGNSLSHLSIWDDLINPKSSAIPYAEVMFACLTGIALGFLITKGDTNKWLNWVAQWLNLSHKYGDENLFSYYLYDLNEYVYVRCKRQGFTYMGLVRAFSETEEIKELVLKDVTVYDYETSSPLYELKELYVSLLKDDVVIELPKPITNAKSE